MVYRPGTVKRNNKINENITSLFWTEFGSYLANISTHCNQVVLCGDFNFHLENNTGDAQKFLILVNMHDFDPLPDFQLQSTYDKGGVLDAFFVSGDSFSPQRCLGDLSIKADTGTVSDHYLVTAILETDVITADSNLWVRKFVRNLKDIDLNLIKTDIKQSELSSMVMKCQNSNDAANVYNKLLTEIIDKHAPLSEKNFRVSRTPWWNSECQNARRKRRAAERAFRKIKSSQNKRKYYEACSLAQKIYLTQREEYYKGKLIDQKGDARATYNIVNQLLDKCSEKCNMSLSNHIDVNNFADFFDNKIKQIYDEIHAERGTNENESGEAEMGKMSCHTILRNFHPLTLSDMKAIIDSLPPKTCELDPFPISMVKQCSDLLLPAILHIANLSLINGIFPEVLK